MKIKFYQAECGDTARIKFLGNDDKNHNILIDAGFKRTFRFVLGDEIKQIEKDGEVIDLWILTHIHDDHIGGVIKYLDLIKTGEFKDLVNQWYYNIPRFYGVSNRNLSIKISSPKSISQGDVIYEYLKINEKISKIDITSELDTIDIFGMKLTVLTPSVEKLNKLREKYPFGSVNELEKSELTSISEAKARKPNDYKIKLVDFDIEDFTEDKSIENGSSISIITEYDKKKILWLADSHPSDVITSLQKLGYSIENQFECDWIKVSHHGSTGNNSNELYDLIKCNNYLFSANSENKHNLPFKECIARILRNKNRNMDSTYNLYFTYDNETIRSIFKIDGVDGLNDFNFKVNFLSNSKYLEIEL
ncbi:MBL fold metallo-hydrolase [Flavobacterium buctense]|uniref:MBL fold metallo-hydrolase n=1 Tax=Flavobacterium buctense TaxID=1648146 RepID=UPI003608E178